jgi:hypothetical protein
LIIKQIQMALQVGGPAFDFTEALDLNGRAA